MIVPLVALEAVLRRLVGQRSRRFEQQLMALLQAGRHDELLPLYHGQWLLRFAAPRYLMLGKLGLIHARTGQHEHAAVAYREALRDAGADGQYALALGLAGSLYELGEHKEAEQIYRSTVDEDHVNVQACARLSRLILKRGGDPAEAERFLRLGVEAARGGELRCELVEGLVAQGKLEQAREELGRAEQELAQSSDPQAQAALERARGALER